MPLPSAGCTKGKGAVWSFEGSAIRSFLVAAELSKLCWSRVPWCFPGALQFHLPGFRAEPWLASWWVELAGLAVYVWAWACTSSGAEPHWHLASAHDKWLAADTHPMICCFDFLGWNLASMTLPGYPPRDTLPPLYRAATQHLTWQGWCLLNLHYLLSSAGSGWSSMWGNPANSPVTPRVLRSRPEWVKGRSAQLLPCSWVCSEWHFEFQQKTSLKLGPAKLEQRRTWPLKNLAKYFKKEPSNSS